MGVIVILFFFFTLARHDFFLGHDFYFLINWVIGFFFFCLSLFFVNWTSFYGGVCVNWTSFYPPTFPSSHRFLFSHFSTSSTKGTLKLCNAASVL